MAGEKDVIVDMIPATATTTSISDLSTIKLATFNVWGLYTAKNRFKRMQGIAAHLRTTDYAVIGLQEVWVRKDYEFLASELSEAYPFSYYFKSGQMGSGMATFSKYPIKQAIFHRFLLNGQAHHVWHGDWWSGKGVGLTRIQVSDDFSLNFYNTHLHAEYNKESNDYLGHRISQMQQLFQFVQMSSASPESPKFMNVIAGDLNTYPGCFSFDLFLKQDIVGSKMRDCAKEIAGPTAGAIANTFNIEGNSFAKTKKPEQRIDYILYSGSEANMAVKSYSVLKEDKLADKGRISLSDHCLLEVEFDLNSKSSKTQTRTADDEISSEEQCNLIKKTIAVLSKDIHYTKRSQKRHMALSVVQLILFLAITIGVSLILTFGTLPLIVTLLAFVLAPGFLIGAILSGLIALVWLPEELAHLHGFASQWNLLLMARGVETLPIAGIVDAMDSNPEAIEQMCTITGSKFDKNLIKQILTERRKSMAATPTENDKRILAEDVDEISAIKAANTAKNSEFSTIQIDDDPLTY
jgi:sphingomyelin phosphodiesterase 2